jgi:hypothetical protein
MMLAVSRQVGNTGFTPGMPLLFCCRKISKRSRCAQGVGNNFETSFRFVTGPLAILSFLRTLTEFRSWRAIFGHCGLS